MAKMKLYSSRDQIGTAITKAANQFKNNRREWQRIGLSVLQDLERTRNMDYVHILVESMPQGLKVNSMKDWLCAFGQVKQDDDAKNGLAFNRDVKEPDLTGAAAKEWYKFSPEPEYKGTDFVADLARVLAKAEKALNSDDDTKKTLDNIPEGFFNKIKSDYESFAKVS